MYWRCDLPRCVNRSVLLDLLDHTLKIRIATAKASCEPIPTLLGNPLAISDNLELTGLPELEDCFYSKTLFDEGHETRGLGLVVQSCRAVNSIELQWLPAQLIHRHNDGVGCYGITLEDLDTGRHSCLVNLNFYSRDAHDITRLRIKWESRSYHLHYL